MDSDRILIGCSVKARNSEYSNLETEYLFKTISELLVLEKSQIQQLKKF